jgi:hypothetical protein
MTIRKALLRSAARRVYEADGAAVRNLQKRGYVPDSLLDVAGRTVAVRTAADREFSVSRRADGEIATLTNADEAAVVAPAIDDSDNVEIYAFDPKVVIEAAKKEITARKALYPTISDKGPIFLSLDAYQSDSVPLASKARWKKVLALREIPRSRLRPEASATGSSVLAFRERVHREWAELLGMPEDEVAVDLHILGRRGKSRSRNKNP